MTAKINAYAVMTNALGPEARYWKDIGVTLIPMDAEQFLDEMLSNFTLDESEWADKSKERVKEKKRIARKAVDMIQKKAADHTLNILIDEGSTCLYLAHILLERILHDQIPASKVTIYTNSAPIIGEMGHVNMSPDQCLQFISIGGELKHSYVQVDFN